MKIFRTHTKTNNQTNETIKEKLQILFILKHYKCESTKVNQITKTLKLRKKTSTYVYSDTLLNLEDIGRWMSGPTNLEVYTSVFKTINGN